MRRAETLLGIVDCGHPLGKIIEHGAAATNVFAFSRLGRFRAHRRRNGMTPSPTFPGARQIVSRIQSEGFLSENFLQWMEEEVRTSRLRDPYQRGSRLP
jgi:hypothetical protein